MSTDVKAMSDRCARGDAQPLPACHRPAVKASSGPCFGPTHAQRDRGGRRPSTLHAGTSRPGPDPVQGLGSHKSPFEDDLARESLGLGCRTRRRPRSLERRTPRSYRSVAIALVVELACFTALTATFKPRAAGLTSPPRIVFEADAESDSARARLRHTRLSYIVFPRALGAHARITQCNRLEAEALGDAPVPRRFVPEVRTETSRRDTLPPLLRSRLAAARVTGGISQSSGREPQTHRRHSKRLGERPPPRGLAGRAHSDTSPDGSSEQQLLPPIALRRKRSSRKRSRSELERKLRQQRERDREERDGGADERAANPPSETPAPVTRQHRRALD